MDHFYLTLPSDSSGYYFPANTIADFRTKLATPLELEHGKWEVRLIEISYPKEKKKLSLDNTLHLDSEEITFHVKHYESVFDPLTNIPRFYEPSINENFVRTFSRYINKYQFCTEIQTWSSSFRRIMSPQMSKQRIIWTTSQMSRRSTALAPL